VEPFLLALVVLLGAALGSFSYCMSLRLISGESFLIQSRCGHCKAEILLRDLIPVVSYLWLKAQCRSCKILFSKSYLYAELFVMTLCLMGYFALGQGAKFWIYTSALPFFAIAIFTDLKIQKVPDLSSLGIATLGLLQILIFENYKSFTSLIVLFFLMLILKFVFAKALHKNALGDGDFYLILAASLWLNPLNLPLYIFLLGMMGMITSFYWRWKFHAEQFPFAPAILFSMVTCYLFF